MKTLAPAKINWTLEVLGRRDDGYHEIRSVMQTIDLCDEVFAERSGEPTFETTDGKALSEDDLIVRATRVLERRTGRPLPAAIRVEKRIPIASGLGGGSSDAAAVLRLLNELYGLEMSKDDLVEIASEIGSDVPFLVFGGTALVEGRGDKVMPLSDIFDIRVLITVPSVEFMPDKTRRMYDAITPDDYTDGWKSLMTAERVSANEHLAASDLRNVFDSLLEENSRLSIPSQNITELVAAHRRAMEESGVEAVHVCGSGPSLFGIPELTRGDEIADCLRRTIDGQVYVAWTLVDAEATAVTD